MYIILSAIPLSLKFYIVFALSIKSRIEMRSPVLGELELNLTRIPRPAKEADRCTMKMLPLELSKRAIEDVTKKPRKYQVALKKIKKVTSKGNDEENEHGFVNLFECKRLRGFWPCYSEVGGGAIAAAVSCQILLTKLVVSDRLHLCQPQTGTRAKEQKGVPPPHPRSYIPCL